MAYTVTVSSVSPQWIAAGRGEWTAPREIAPKMLGLLGVGWNLVRAQGLKNDGINVAIYRGHLIEAGPRVFEKFDGCAATPSGIAASVIHMGPYERLGEAHAAVREWAKENGRELEGTNWEIYGHHEDDPARRRTDVYYLLR